MNKTVTIIGAGIVGMSAAAFAQQRGFKGGDPADDWIAAELGKGG